MGWAQALKDRGLDFYRRIPSDLTFGTNVGGVLSLCGGCTLFLLFILELNAFLTISHHTSIVLDDYEDELLQIHFNVSLHRVPCTHASIDVADTLGAHKLNLTRHVRKWRLLNEDVRLQEVHERSAELTYDETSFGAAADTHGDGGVDVTPRLDRSNFVRYVSDHDIVFVLFYAPWCIWCQKLSPVWEKTARMLEDEPFGDVSARMAKVDCTHRTERHLCYDHRVAAFPTMLLFQDHERRSHQRFDGHRTVEALIDFVRRAVRTSAARGDTAAAEDALGSRTAVELDTAAKGASKAAQELGRPLAEGCLVQGDLMVHKVPGTMRITPHSTQHSLSHHDVNVSHTIHHLAFGPANAERRLRQEGRGVSRDMRELLALLVGSKTNSLDGVTFPSREANLTHEHYLKVVSSDMELLNDNHVKSYRYTASSSTYNLNHDDAGGADHNPWEVNIEATDAAVAADGGNGASHAALAHSTTLETPSIKISYDLSPMHIAVEEVSMPLYRFITSVCAIIGGVFTTIGLIDALLFRLAQTIGKKMD